MDIQAILQHPKDTVVTLTKEARPGDRVLYEGGNITAEDCIPQWHKIALSDISQGQVVYKYGEEIGKATTFIGKGHRVDDKNLAGLSRKYEDEYVGDVPWEMLLLCSPQVCDGSSLSANRVSYRMTLVCFLIERQYVDAGGTLA